MSSDDNHRQTHMTPMDEAVFTTSSFNFGLKTYLVHAIVTEGHYMLCSIKKLFLKNSRAELFEVVWQMTCQSRVTHVAVYRVDTMFLFC